MRPVRNLRWRRLIMTVIVKQILLAGAVALALSACGKKGPLEPPKPSAIAAVR